MVNLLVAAALAAAQPPTASPLPPSAPAAAPAMFVVRDVDTTVYIFGTFHALDGQAQWFNDHVREAFDRSNELVLETVIPEHPQPVQPSVPPALGHAIGVIPRHHANGDHGGALAGHAGG
jgi:uncharacterized protein